MDTWQVCRLRAPDGIELAVHCRGQRSDPPVLLLHGGGQTGWAWQETARRLSAAGYYCLAADLRGHGSSGWAGEDGYSLDHFAADVRTMVDQLCPQPPVAVGASLGGISAMIAEGDSDQRWLQSLVLVDVTPRWEADGFKRILGFLSAHPDGFDSLEAAAEAVRDYLPHRARRVSAEGLRRNLRQGKDGRWQWHWDPNMLSEAHRTTAEWQPRLAAAAERIEVPTLLISGGCSDFVSANTIEEFMTLVPHARHVEIDDAHHMVAGDSNDSFSTTILDYLASDDARLTA